MSEPNLVQPEGVNAGSAESTTEDGDVPTPASTRGGGDPDDAPSPYAATDPADPGDDELIGAGDVQEESGQDSGSNS